MAPRPKYGLFVKFGFFEKRDNYKVHNKDSSKEITKVTNSSLLVGQAASGPPSYIQVRPPGADFRGPGAQKHQFKDQKQEKRLILSPPSDLLQTLYSALVSKSPRF